MGGRRLHGQPIEESLKSNVTTTHLTVALLADSARARCASELSRTCVLMPKLSLGTSSVLDVDETEGAEIRYDKETISFPERSDTNLWMVLVEWPM